jgi:hypothetical protein
VITFSPKASADVTLMPIIIVLTVCTGITLLRKASKANGSYLPMLISDRHKTPEFCFIIL